MKLVLYPAKAALIAQQSAQVAAHLFQFFIIMTVSQTVLLVPISHNQMGVMVNSLSHFFNNKDCDPKCQTCDSLTSCSTCLNLFPYLHNGACMIKCPDGTFADSDKKCQSKFFDNLNNKIL